jgi:acetoin utilization deacetylase AcuC-like enzyme
MDKVEIANEDKIEELLELVHTKELINKVREDSLKLNDGETIYDTKSNEYYMSKETYEISKVSASAVITGTKQILESKHDTGYCIVRPPGHHAKHDESLGFCFFNNVALAAKMATSAPYNLERVCIFDWDIHHGDGT